LMEQALCWGWAPITLMCQSHPMTLARRARPYRPKRATAVEVFKARQVSALLASLPPVIDELTAANVAAGLQKCVDELSCGNIAAAAKQADMPKSLLWTWLKGHGLPSLGAILRFCLGFRLSLVGLLCGKCVAADESPKYVPKTPRKRRKNLIEFEDRRRALVKAISRRVPPSLTSLTRELGLSRRALPSQFPDLCSLLIQRAAEHRRRVAESRAAAAESEFQRAIARLSREKMAITRRNLERLLGSPVLPWSRYGTLLRSLREGRSLKHG